MFMKNMLIIVQVLVMAFLAKIFTTSTPKIEYTSTETPIEQVTSRVPTSSVHNKTALRSRHIVNNKELISFLKETAQARRMVVEESKLALKRSTNKEIRAYGKLVLRDQAKILEEIKALAKKRNITLSDDLSKDQIESLQALHVAEKNEFDRKFVRMIKNDHKRDVRKFKNDSESNDPEVSKLSEKYRPIIKLHLDKVKELK